MPRVGSLSRITSGWAISHLAMTTFCWLPPERVATGCLGRADLDVELLDGGVDRGAGAGLVDQRAAGDAGEGGGEQVVGDRAGEHQALGLAVLGDEGDAGGAGLGGGGRGREAAGGAEANLALDAAEHAEEREQQLLLALAVEAAEADDLAGADGEVDALEAVLPGEAADGEAAARGARGAPASAGTAPRRRGRSSGGRSRRAMRAPLAKVSMWRPLRNTERVSQSASTSCIRCEMKIEATPCGLEVGEERVDGLDVAAGQRRGRLVEDQDDGVAADRLGDLDHLPARQAEVADQRARVDVLAGDAGEEPLGAGGAGRGGRSGRGASAGRRARCCRRPSGRGSATAPGRCRRCRRGSPRRGWRRRRARPSRRSSPESGRKHAGDDLDQRRLAGAVLAEDGVDRAGGGRRSRRLPGRGRPGSAWRRR